MNRIFFFILFVSLIFFIGASKEISYVTQDEQVALIELPYGKNEMPMMIGKIDGKLFHGLKPRGAEKKRWVFGLELPPGLHSFEATVFTMVENKQNPFKTPLSIELNAVAGHNYRFGVQVYDKDTTSIYIEDINTGEVVSGHRTEGDVNP